MTYINSNKAPKISVVMPVYNSAKYLDQAVQSILNQTYDDFEFLMLDDGSSDGSLKILQYYAKLDSRCKVITGENKGMVARLNEGISLAKADIIFRMDSDDISRPERFKQQLHHLECNLECVAVGAKALLIDSEGLPITEMWGDTKHENIDKFHLMGIGANMCHPATAIRKDSILKVGGYREECQYAEDLDLWLRLAEIGRLENLPEVLIEYRQHVESVGYKRRDAQLKATRFAVLEAKNRRGLVISSKLSEDAEEASVTMPSLSEIHLKWAWWALMDNNRTTAKKHGLNAFLKNPFTLSWVKFFYCFYFKRFTKKPD